MRRINNIFLLFALCLLFACIKPFEPLIDAGDANKYVVSGRVTDSTGWQTVEISLSSPVGLPSYIPVQFCQVMIQDDKGHDFALEEFLPGQYRVWMEKEVVVPGTAYRVLITTPQEESLASGYDTMPYCAPLDSLYYSIEDLPTTDPVIFNRVMQFYIDLDARGNFSKNYKWEVEETWESHAAQPKEYYYDGTHHQIYPPDYADYYCWATKPVKDVFTVSTVGLSQNTYSGYPLHAIDGHTSRLSVLYSFLLRQFALSGSAYNYWEQMRINSNEQGGLYEKQPLAVKGNMMNLSHPDQSVLGYFYAASETSRRYFYRNVEGIQLDFDNKCFEEQLYVGGFRNYYPEEYPVYYYYLKGAVRVLSRECVECWLLGGKTVKPDFWPN